MTIKMKIITWKFDILCKQMLKKEDAGKNVYGNKNMSISCHNFNFEIQETKRKNSMINYMIYDIMIE